MHPERFSRAQAVLAVARLTDYSRDLTVNVGTISGGIGHNTVPVSAHALLEMRVSARVATAPPTLLTLISMSATIGSARRMVNALWPRPGRRPATARASSGVASSYMSSAAQTRCADWAVRGVLSPRGVSLFLTAIFSRPRRRR